MMDATTANDRKDGDPMPRSLRLFALMMTLGGISVAIADERPAPSFPCDKARAPDEIAICSDAQLAELDKLRSEDFRKAKLVDPKAAINAARENLEARSACANDRVCILDVLRYYDGGAPEPAWVEGYRAKLVREVVGDDLSVRSYASVGRRSSFATSSKGVQATLTSIDGVDTDHASATAMTTPADFMEYCERDPGGETKEHGGELSIKQCAVQEQATMRAKPLATEADCKAKTVTIEGDTWRFLRYDAAITWKTPKGAVEEPWAGTSAVDAQFEMLCPNAYARVRADAAERETGRAKR